MSGLQMLPDLGTVNYLVALGALLVAIVGFARWVLPRARAFFHKVNSALDTIGGSDEIRDPQTDLVLRAAQPALGVRLGNVEAGLGAVATALVELGEIRTHLARHDDQIRNLEQAAVERIVTKAESAAAWQAVTAAHEPPPATPPEEQP